MERPSLEEIKGFPSEERNDIRYTLDSKDSSAKMLLKSDLEFPSQMRLAECAVPESCWRI